MTRIQFLEEEGIANKSRLALGFSQSPTPLGSKVWHLIFTMPA